MLITTLYNCTQNEKIGCFGFELKQVVIVRNEKHSLCQKLLRLLKHKWWITLSSVHMASHGLSGSPEVLGDERTD